LQYRDGRKELYWRLSARDGKKLKAVLPTLLQNSTGAVTPAGGMVSLCPKCLATLTPNTYRCAQCGQLFKDEKTLQRFLLIPGGEYFYVGQNHIGALHGLGQAMWLLAIGFYSRSAPDEPVGRSYTFRRCLLDFRHSQTGRVHPLPPVSA
jgi:hypothetical protein